MSGLFDDFADEDLDTLADDVAAGSTKGETVATDEPQEMSPRTTADLYDHADVEARLLADFNAGRMPHAIVISGSEGIGKATLAYRLARFVLSQREDDGGGLFGPAPQPETLALEPQHEVFRRVASGGHTDLLIVEREMDEKKGRLKKNISADDARHVATFLRKTAAEGGWRVVIVDGAESVNTASQNALLKILEEPPAKALLIVTTSHPGSLLPTIRSRCRMIALKSLSDATMEKMLQRAIPGLSVQEKSILLRIGAGSIGKALSFHAAQGPDIYKSLLAGAQDLPQLDMVKVHALADKLGRGSDEGFALCQEIMIGWCDQIVRAAARGITPADMLPGDSALLGQWQAMLGQGHFLMAGDKLRQFFAAVDNFNLDRRQAIISAFMVLQNPEYQALGAA